MDKYFENLSLVTLVWKWKWHLLATIVGAAILAAIFSGPYFITPKYKSRAVIYPSNIAPYSEESETEQLLQWLHSRDIKDSVIQRFNLAEHYEIDTGYEHYYSTMLWEYDQNVSISKTQYESIEIEVLDKDPKKAKDIVNEIIDLVNNKIRRMHRDKFQEVVEISRRMLVRKEKELDSIKNKMRTFGTEYGIYDVGGQSTEVTEGFLKTVDSDAAPNYINVKGVKQLNEALKSKGGEYLMYKAYIPNLMNRYKVVKKQYEEALRNVKKEFTFTNTVTKPYISDKKAYPTRWLIVFYAVAAALFLAVVVIAILEKQNKLKARDQN
ncbi:MAG: hypothetical protein K9I68_07860 [Bacteroidales bacterium]|nr:hypothetical protein [Bacteroidales bacterium]